MGVIYILENPSFPKYVKIGYADSLEERLVQLNSSAAVPFAFRAYAVYEVSERLSDKRVHALIDQLNPDLRAVEIVNGKTRTKEFFEMSASDAYKILETIAVISGTKDKLKKFSLSEDDKKAEKACRDSRRPPFTFSYVGIPVGAELIFDQKPDQKAVVVDDRHIRVRDNIITSLSGEAEYLLGKHSLPGPMFWSYKGRVLSDMRDEADRNNGLDI